MHDEIAILVAVRGDTELLRDDWRIPVAGRPLLAYALLAATASQVTRIYVTTASPGACEFAAAHGATTIMRPPHLRGRSGSLFSVVVHAIEIIERETRPLAGLVLINGNVAAFRDGLIDDSVQILTDNPHVDTVLAVTEMNEFHPLRAKRLRMEILSVRSNREPPPFYLEPYLDVGGEISTNRQDLAPAYFPTFAAVALRLPQAFQQHGQWPHEFCGRNVVGLNTEHAREIFSPEDVAYTEEWIRRHTPSYLR